MKKTLGIFAVALLSLTLGFAQTPDRNANTTDQNNRIGEREPERNWGWVGLLGLAGLGGLAGRKRDVSHNEEHKFRKAA